MTRGDMRRTCLQHPVQHGKGIGKNRKGGHTVKDQAPFVAGLYQDHQQEKQHREQIPFVHPY